MSSDGLVTACDSLQKKISEANCGLDNATSLYSNIYSEVEALKKRVVKELSQCAAGPPPPPTTTTTTITTATTTTSSFVIPINESLMSDTVDSKQQDLFEKKKLLEMKEAELRELRRQVEVESNTD